MKATAQQQVTEGESLKPKPTTGWTQWEGSNSMLSMAHAMRLEDPGKACCGAVPGEGIKTAPAPLSAPKCSKCIRLLAIKANPALAKVKRPDPKTVYSPRFTFDDWEKGR